MHGIFRYKSSEKSQKRNLKCGIRTNSSDFDVIALADRRHDFHGDGPERLQNLYGCGSDDPSCDRGDLCHQRERKSGIYHDLDFADDGLSGVWNTVLYLCKIRTGKSCIGETAFQKKTGDSSVYAAGSKRHQRSETQ